MPNCRAPASPACAALLAVFLAQSANAQVSGLAAERVASGLSSPLFVDAPRGDYNRLFIVQQGGRIRILNLATHTLNATPFLDISAAVVSGGERGLLGLAFDPNYASNGKFYVDYTAPGGAFGAGITRVSQFTVSANPDVADPASERLLISFDQPQTNHNAGWIGFSPRTGDTNILYITAGDGGGGNDVGTGHLEPGGNAQNLTTLLGKILRIRVDATSGTYTIPPGNPFVATPGARGEIWAFGLRNPYRASFDRTTGDMFIADVGQNTREEVDVQKATNPNGGENYGWRLREGTIATPASGIGGAQPPGGVNPIIDYPRTVGGTVIGGYIYRGRQIPALRGTYVFGDYVDRKVFTLDFNGATASNFRTITSQLFPTAAGGFTLSALSSFGEDANGELYITDLGNGSVFKIVPVTPNVEIASVRRGANGHVIVRGSGVPFKNHTMQATATLVEPFADVATVTAAGDGTFEYDDASATSETRRFYRAVYP